MEDSDRGAGPGGERARAWFDTDPDERLRRLSEATFEGIAIHEDGVILDANDVLAAMVGYPIDDLVGRHALELAAPESRERVLRAIREGRETPYEVYAQRADGSVFPVELCGKPLEADGRRLRVTAIRDITARRAAQAALARSEERLRVLVEQAADGIVVASSEGTILEVNRAICRMSGRSRAALIGSELGALFDPDELRREPLELDVLTRGARLVRERLLRRAEGSVLPVEISAVALSDGRFQGIVRDITERREREALEHRFFQAQKMESVGRLAGGIAHDFNNLLTVILGSADVLAQADEPTKIRRLAEQIGEAAEQGARLTRQLLAFSRRQVLEPRRIDLSEVVRSSASVLRRLIGEDVGLQVRCAREPLFVEADPTQIEQILMNLAVNARDAMPDGGTLTLRTERWVDPEGDGRPVARLSVEDSGVGMDEGVLRHALEPFFTTKAPGAGTGLGLSTVYGIVTQSGGALRLRSRPGEGTAVRVQLPLLDADEGSERARPELARAEEPAARVLSILLVEDEPEVRSTIAMLLRREGHRVETAPGAAEAEAIAAREAASIDLLLTDVVLSDGSGRALAERLQRTCPDLPVLFTSGYANDAFARAVGEVPPATLLPKPFSRQELRAAIHAVFERE